MRKAYFPMFMDISEKKILVIGGGQIAARRIKTLLRFAEDIKVVAPRICEELRELEQQGKIVWVKRGWVEADAEGMDIVLAAADSRAVNHRAVVFCNESGILVNSADDKKKCDFYFPAIVEKDDLIIGIGANGENPAKVKAARQQLEDLLKDTLS